jgi:hypothetical protein
MTTAFGAASNHSLIVDEICFSESMDRLMSWMLEYERHSTVTLLANSRRQTNRKNITIPSIKADKRLMLTQVETKRV